MATEERIALDLPFDRLGEVINLAISLFGEESVLDTICNRLGQSRQTVGNDIDSWIKNGLSEHQIRIAIGKAAKSKEWFKKIDPAEQLGKIVALALPTIPSSDLAEKLMGIAAWAYES